MNTRSSILVLSLGLSSIFACGGPPAASGPSGGGAAKNPSRWEEIADLDGTEATLTVSGDHLWITSGPRLLTLGAPGSKPAERFAGNKERFASICESNGHVYAVGIDGTATGVMAHAKASEGGFKRISQPKMQPLRGTWCGSTAAFAVGDKNAIYRASTESDDTAVAWTEVPSPKGFTTLHAIHGSGIDDVWAVGDGGTILHSTGAAFEAVTSGATETLRAVWSKAKDDVYVAGDKATVLHTTDGGKTWSKIDPGPRGSELRAVFAEGSLVALGERDGAILISDDGGAHFATEDSRQGGVGSFGRAADGRLLAATAWKIVARPSKPAK